MASKRPTKRPVKKTASTSRSKRYDIEVKRSAERELAKLPADVQQRITGAIDKLRASPRPRSSEKIEGADDQRRVRVGDYRVVYTIMKSVLVIQIIRIRHRRDVYRR